MKLRIPLWLALVLCLGSVALGSVWGQEKKPDPKEPPVLTEYPYLPNHYGEAFIPSVADWQAMRLTALGASTTRITEQFSRQHLTCFADRKGLSLTLDLLPQPGWKFYAAGGKFTAPVEKVKPDIQKAVDANLSFIRAFFPEVQDKDMSIQIYIKSEGVGMWENGALTLKAEKTAGS
jgi:hypothetical protein